MQVVKTHWVIGDSVDSRFSESERIKGKVT